ncbi:MAG: hypothetical protein HYX66_10275 [Ignavibacteria bacterium]|nr:hypothetical protein [Ignavibacteria bacterium]
MFLRRRYEALLVIHAICAVHAICGESQYDSAYMRAGGHGIVYAGAGTFVGGYLLCNDGSYKSTEQGCPGNFVKRSFDGGVTWKYDTVRSAEPSLDQVVRLANGQLIATSTLFRNGFNASVDHGQNWQTLSEGTGSSYSPTVWGRRLRRDATGNMYWVDTYGRGFSSIDGGLTSIEIESWEFGQLDDLYIIGQGILAVKRWFVAAQNEVKITTNNGISWRTLWPRKNEHYSARQWGITLIDDTLVLDISTNDTGLVESYLRYDIDADSLVEAPELEMCFSNGNVLDSAGFSYTSQYLFLSGGKRGKRDCELLIRSAEVPADDPRLPPGGLPQSAGGIYGVFMDIEGNIHPYGSEVYVQANAPRPISVLDRILDCDRITYVLGGPRMGSIRLIEKASTNAELRFRVELNRRIAEIEVSKIDKTRSMSYQLIIVGNGIQDTLIIADSTYSSLPSKPVIKVISRNDRATALQVEWTQGPFYWLRNGEILRTLSGDARMVSPLKDPSVGIYSVVARDVNGCIVKSEDVSVLITDLADAREQEPEIDVHRDEGSRLVIQSNTADLAGSVVKVYNMIGQLLLAQELGGGISGTFVIETSAVGPVLIRIDGGNVHFAKMIL